MMNEINFPIGLIGRYDDLNTEPNLIILLSHLLCSFFPWFILCCCYFFLYVVSFEFIVCPCLCCCINFLGGALMMQMRRHKFYG